MTFRNLHTQWLVLPLSTYYNSEHKLPPAKFFSFIHKPPTASIRLSGKPGDVPTTAIFGYLIFCSSSTAIPSATTDYARMENAALSSGDHVGLPRVLIHIAPHFQYLNFCSSKTAMMHNFGDHRLRTHGDRRFIDQRSCWPSQLRSFLLTIHLQLSP